MLQEYDKECAAAVGGLSSDIIREEEGIVAGYKSRCVMETKTAKDNLKRMQNDAINALDISVSNDVLALLQQDGASLSTVVGEEDHQKIRAAALKSIKDR